VADTNAEDEGTAPLLATNELSETGVYGSLASATLVSKTEVSPPSIIWRLFILFKHDIITANVVKCVSDLLQFANPQLLR
jgi:hypothetical protein